MNPKKIYPILLLLFGEALIITCFLYFGKNLDTGILKLNIIVSSVIYALFFIDILFPMVDFKDKSHKTVGSLGIRWFVTFFYMLVAIGFMVVFNTVKPIDLTSQILLHCIFFFLLVFGLFSAVSSSQKVNDVYAEETQNRSRVDEMKKATKAVQLKLDQMKDIPSDIITSVTNIQANLRFISPSNNIEAIELETSFIKEIKVLHDSLFDIPINYDRINVSIQNCERIYKERKSVFSN